MKTNEKLDKDRFRRDLGGLIESYTDIANRMSLKLPELKAEL
jgi:phosphoribosylaminoimidazole-succinocarboxamide synthase